MLQWTWECKAFQHPVFIFFVHEFKGILFFIFWGTSILFPQRRQWQPTQVLLPRKSHGWRSLVGCSPWGREESDTTERLHSHFSLSCLGGGNGIPLQCSCLENPRDGGAWWAAIYGVAQCRTQLKRLSSSSHAVIQDWLCHHTFPRTVHTVSVSPHLCPHLLFLIFLMTVILTGMRWHLMGALSCPPLMISNAKILFPCLLAIGTPSLEKRPFRFSAHVLIGLFFPIELHQFFI